MSRRRFRRDYGSAINFHLRDERSAISDHLRTHVHLTNCIHLRNHMHRPSPIMGERPLIRDLIDLQRSRSLRDPSTSPSSWISPSMVNLRTRSNVKASTLLNGYASSVHDRRINFSSGDVNQPFNANINGFLDTKENKIEEPNSSKNPPKRKKVSRMGKNRTDFHPKTLSEQLEKVPNPAEEESGQVSHAYIHRNKNIVERICEDPEASSYGNHGRLRKKKKNRLRGTRYRGGKASRTCHDLSKNVEVEDSHEPVNGCGIPWNWSRIHHRGKTFLDKAGRSLTCGLSDPKLRKSEEQLPTSQSDKDVLNKAIASNPVSPSPDSDSESLPLLEVSGSPEKIENAATGDDYSGELGIFSNHSARNEHGSELESQGGSSHRHRSRRHHHHWRHRSLTEKYTPKTFKDLVGQNLVVQALSNAAMRRRVGLIYVFYGHGGTGKTSCARVFAKALNCQSLDFPKPCDACPSCISHNLGKSRNMVEIGQIGSFDFESIMDVLDNVVSSPVKSQFRVFIIDDCDSLSHDSWSFILKVIDQAPRHVVFVLISTNLENLPHMIISRCQKFLFPKLKDSDIVFTLQRIATSEGLEIDKDALKLIASRSDGSLRDALMTLDQLSLLGRQVSLSVVQELVGLASDEKLVDLLDLALSADAVNTVKMLREIMETGVEPLALMSQLATIITDILAGSYAFPREKVRRKFFRRMRLSKEDTEKLRHALKSLAEAEKQLRSSNDRSTWLTAALLQLAPDQLYMHQCSPESTSNSHSSTAMNDTIDREILRNSTNMPDDMHNGERALSRKIGINKHSNRLRSDATHGKNKTGNTHLRSSPGATKAIGVGKTQTSREKIWWAVLENLQSDALKHFLYQEGRLISVSRDSALSVQLMFDSYASKSKAEKYTEHISQAFEHVLGSAVVVKMTCLPRADRRPLDQVPISSQSFGQASFKDNAAAETGSSQVRKLYSDSYVNPKDEIIEVPASPETHKQVEQRTNSADYNKNSLDNGCVEEASCLQQQRKESGEPSRRQSLVKGKVSLARVLQHAEGCKKSNWSKRKAISIAEKLEQENLRLEPRSRSLLCWRSSRVSRRKLPHLKIRTRRSRALLRFMTCGRCIYATPR